MADRCELTYEGKQPEAAIIADTPVVQLQQLQAFGGAYADSTHSGDWANMLLFGDNLPILKTLAQYPNIKGQVRLVYIDPPFATNQEFRTGGSRTVSRSRDDEVAYHDRLAGAEYIEFLRKRLILLRELLADDGSIYVHLDWRAGPYVKIVMDEVFGEAQYINTITRVKCNPKSFKRRAYGNIADMVLFYGKTRGRNVWNDARESMSDDGIHRLFSKTDVQGRAYTTLPLHAPGETLNGPTGRPWKGVSPPKGSHWQYPPERLTELDEQGLIEWSATGNPRRIHYAEDLASKGKKRQDVWEFKDPPYPSYPTEKNADMLQVIIEASSNPGDIVLDCFAGSGTTLACAEASGRRWIGVDSSPWAVAATVKRLLAPEGLSRLTLSSAGDVPLPEAFQEFLQQERAEGDT